MEVMPWGTLKSANLAMTQRVCAYHQKQFYLCAFAHMLAQFQLGIILCAPHIRPQYHDVLRYNQAANVDSEAFIAIVQHDFNIGGFDIKLSRFFSGMPWDTLKSANLAFAQELHPCAFAQMLVLSSNSALYFAVLCSPKTVALLCICTNARSVPTPHYTLCRSHSITV